MGICNDHLSNPQCLVCAFVVKPNTQLRLDFSVQSWTSVIPVDPFQLPVLWFCDSRIDKVHWLHHSQRFMAACQGASGSGLP